VHQGQEELIDGKVALRLKDGTILPVSCRG
jgi:hypothetical protein